MKKTIIKITATAVLTFLSFMSFAQQIDRKAKIDDSNKTTVQDKTTTAIPALQMVITPKAMTVKEQPKPIVPGGEFKPMDTDKPVKNYAKTAAPEKVIDQQGNSKPAPVKQGDLQKEQ